MLLKVTQVMEEYGQEKKNRKMKILIFIISITFYLPAYCQQQNIDTVYIKGYRVMEYKKSEIEFSIKNEILRKEGRSYQKMIDLEQREFFIPFDSTKSLSKLLKERNALNQKEMFYLPNNHEIESYIKKVCNVTVDLSKQKSLFNVESSNYYANEQGEYLYKFYFIEGNSLLTTVENNEVNKLKLDISSDEIDRNLGYFKVYFLFDIKKIKCNEDYSCGFKIWKYHNQTK